LSRPSVDVDEAELELPEADAPRMGRVAHDSDPVPHRRRLMGDGDGAFPFYLRVDAALADGVGDAVDGQHVGGDAVVDAVVSA
jgi:hypothetical protein